MSLRRMLRLGLTLCLTLPLMMAGCQKNGSAGAPAVDGENPPPDAGEENNLPLVTIEMDNGKEILIELYPDIAPTTVNNFIALANSGFYDGLVFHRIIPGFVIQGGDPDGNGTGGPGYSIKGEFTSNGVANNLSHNRGVIPMARSMDPDSAGSQFFIVVDDAAVPSLDGNYAGFGKVVSGMEEVDAIVSGPSTGGQEGTALEPRVMAKVRVDTKGVDYPGPDKVADEPVPTVEDDEREPDGEHPVATIEMDNGAKIVIELYPEIAPESVHNFISLASSGFYDGLVFHRIIPGFVIQGGDPDGNGTGGPGYSIKGEFTSNGVENNLSHNRGVLSMARSMDPDSAGSQFFIVVDDAAIPSLDGNYAGFGKVISGMAEVDAIVSGPSTGGQAGTALEPRVMKTVTIETYGVEYPEPTKLP